MLKFIAPTRFTSLGLRCNFLLPFLVNSSETEEILDEVSGKKKTKAKIVLPNCCWKNSKKQLKEE